MLYVTYISLLCHIIETELLTVPIPYIAEKEELVSLCVSHVNSMGYRRCGSRTTSPFTTLKGITTNINEFITSAFDLRNPAPAPQPQTTAYSKLSLKTF